MYHISESLIVDFIFCASKNIAFIYFESWEDHSIIIAKC